MACLSLPDYVLHRDNHRQKGHQHLEHKQCERLDARPHLLINVSGINRFDAGPLQGHQQVGRWVAPNERGGGCERLREDWAVGNGVGREALGQKAGGASWGRRQRGAAEKASGRVGRADGMRRLGTASRGLSGW